METDRPRLSIFLSVVVSFSWTCASIHLWYSNPPSFSLHPLPSKGWWFYVTSYFCSVLFYYSCHVHFLTAHSLAGNSAVQWCNKWAQDKTNRKSAPSPADQPRKMLPSNGLVFSMSVRRFPMNAPVCSVHDLRIFWKLWVHRLRRVSGDGRGHGSSFVIFGWYVIMPSLQSHSFSS